MTTDWSSDIFLLRAGCLQLNYAIFIFHLLFFFVFTNSFSTLELSLFVHYRAHSFSLYLSVYFL